MSDKDIIFYCKNKAFHINFNAKEISSDSGILLAEKIERNQVIIGHFSNFISDSRLRICTKHYAYKLLKQRPFLYMQGYADANIKSFILQ